MSVNYLTYLVKKKQKIKTQQHTKQNENMIVIKEGSKDLSF